MLSRPTGPHTRCIRDGRASLSESDLSCPARQTAAAKEMLGGTEYYPFPRRAVGPDRQEIVFMLHGCNRLIRKRAGREDERVSGCGAIAATWEPDDVAQAPWAGRTAQMVGAFDRSSGAWRVDPGEHAPGPADKEALLPRLKGLGVLVSACSLAVFSGRAWGLLLLRVEVGLDGPGGSARVLDARLTGDLGSFDAGRAWAV